MARGSPFFRVFRRIEVLEMGIELITGALNTITEHLNTLQDTVDGLQATVGNVVQANSDLRAEVARLQALGLGGGATAAEVQSVVESLQAIVTRIDTETADVQSTPTFIS